MDGGGKLHCDSLNPCPVRLACTTCLISLPLHYYYPLWSSFVGFFISSLFLLRSLDCFFFCSGPNITCLIYHNTYANHNDWLTIISIGDLLQRLEPLNFFS